MNAMSAPKTILLIITGGIAAVKSLELLRRLRDGGNKVEVILTKAAQEFVTPLSVGALNEAEPHTELFNLTAEAKMGHIRLAREADLVAVIPASADFLAKMAHGRADDLASTVLLATTAPVVVAPAMNHRMWAHPATTANVATLQGRGVFVIPPEHGAMACGETGAGRLPEVAALLPLLDIILAGLPAGRPLRGKKALVTSGATHEPLDPVRFLGNHSSGRQGHTLAGALMLAGAEVTLLEGHVSVPAPPGVTVIKTPTAAALYDAALAALPVDIAICAAAVADWQLDTPLPQKQKKNGAGSWTPSFSPTPDTLRALGTHKTSRPRLVIGFAAETENALENARQKRQDKGCDWLIVNEISAENPAFGAATNTVTLLDGHTEHFFENKSKAHIAAACLQKIIA